MVNKPAASSTFAEDHFDSSGVACAVRVYRPSGTGAPAAPCVVMAHGFGAVRALRLYAYAERFAAAGYVVAVFDYRGFGDSKGTPRQVLDIPMQHEDWRAALAYARCLDGVDPDRVVGWGTSFAGGHVISLAGQGEPLAAIIAQVPHISGPAAVRATGMLPSFRVGGVGIRDQVGAWLGRPPVLVDCIGVPGQTAVMTSADAEPAMQKLIDASGISEGDYPVAVAARIGRKIGLYSPSRWAAGVTCPALVQIAEDDAVTPRRGAESAARRMAEPTVHLYPGGHFDPYVEPLFTSVIADQLAFLREHVPVTASQS
ncbi:MAG: alpha/beta hydrolase [Nocardioidaceae bacterium]|nr:alpha/beta hydrolase [Nocardioidaceae bacterium]